MRKCRKRNEMKHWRLRLTGLTPHYIRKNLLPMNRDSVKEPLFRKVNTKARGVHHNFGGDFKYSRNKKRETPEQIHGKMYGKKERGLDYTPLFRFLLSKVGVEWDSVFSEAKSRLDKTEPIYWIVALDENEKEEYVRIGESTYFSGLYVDKDGILQLTNPTLKPTDLTPLCSCCTHTLNGVIFGKKNQLEVL
jgi:hypothetical protein